MTRRSSRQQRRHPVQLALFPEHAALAAIGDDGLPRRVYHLEVWPDLFGRALLVRSWRRIGGGRGRRVVPYSDPGAAVNALARIARAKRRRGYVDA
jgi:predicted DNA-binding WGR domain protein